MREQDCITTDEGGHGPCFPWHKISSVLTTDIMFSHHFISNHSDIHCILSTVNSSCASKWVDILRRYLWRVYVKHPRKSASGFNGKEDAASCDPEDEGEGIQDLREKDLKRREKKQLPRDQKCTLFYWRMHLLLILFPSFTLFPVVLEPRGKERTSFPEKRGLQSRIVRYSSLLSVSQNTQDSVCIKVRKFDWDKNRGGKERKHQRSPDHPLEPKER